MKALGSFPSIIQKRACQQTSRNRPEEEAHTYNPSSQEIEAGGSRVQVQHELHSKNLIQKNKRKKKVETNCRLGLVWWHTFVILTTQESRKEAHKFKPRLGNLMRTFSKENQTGISGRGLA